MPFDKCPHCGYAEGNVTAPYTNVMNQYVDSKGKVSVINSDAETITNKAGEVHTRKDIADKKAAALKKTPTGVAQASITPTPAK